MKIGQAVEHGNWQSAAMTLRRMQDNAAQCGVSDFDRMFTMLRQCVVSRKKAEAQNVLASVVAKRVALLEGIRKADMSKNQEGNE